MKIKEICENKLTELNLNDELYNSRLKDELKEIESQDEEDYFLNLRGKKLDNENNLLVPYLLGICDTFDIKQPPKYEYGDMPDVDVDYIPAVRTYLKEKYSREKFGDEYVCNVATYTTFGLRSALIDMAKVFDLDRKEILNLTTKLGIKDDEGEILTWDTAIELYDDLREYMEKHPDMADAARRILHRNRNMGMHASGLIISGVPIKDFVPLVKTKDSAGACSAWVEGLHGTDLGAVGLVKFDFLSLAGNLKIAQGTRMVDLLAREADVTATEVESIKSGVGTLSTCLDILQRFEVIGKVSALPGKSNWTDVSYLNDNKALEMADKGDLKMIFQYDGSEGIRRLARQGGITSFDDLAAYTALFRPGPMKSGMHEAYCRRKRGQEKYEIHPLLKPFLESTYNVLIYQEQILRLLNVVGKIPLKNCEEVRKSISKKKIDKFQKYKEMFVNNGQITLGWSINQVEHLFDQVTAFAGYGFNMAHTCAYAYISSRMLYLKCHHPLAFYTSVLDCTNPVGLKDHLKLKDYKQEAAKHGIKVNRVDINKSKYAVSTLNNQIYWGFSKIKSVGDEAARRIEQMQPYADYEDFIKRFGTDAKSNQAVIALQLFPGDPVILYHFYEAYKIWEKKDSERRKRYDATMRKNKEIMKSLCGIEVDNYENVRSTLDCQLHKEFDRTWKRMKTATFNFTKKGIAQPRLADFIGETDLQSIDKDYRKLFENKNAAEETFYGFVWDHPLEQCRLYNNFTFEYFTTENNEIGPIDVMIKQVKETKGPKVTYYSVEVEDATGLTRRVTIWTSDYKQFAHLLQKGNCVRMTVKEPTKGFNNFTLNGIPRNRWQKSPKESDLRIISLN